jgi:valyl-tRNA synthetase
LAAAELYDFMWGKFCDWYIEMSKPMLYSADDAQRNGTVNVLLYVLRETLKMLHPFIPFITEKIYDELPNKDAEDIMISTYPQASRSNYYKAAADAELVMDAIRGVRNMRWQMNVPQSKRTQICVIANDGYEKLVNEASDYILKLAGGSELLPVKPEGKVATQVTRIAQIYIPMGDLIDFDKERERLNKEIEVCDNEIARAKGKLANQGFVAKAPAALIEAEKEKIVKYTEQKDQLLKNLNEL